jgi:1,4-dihydroxy-2-naphthoyl-CoA hydrolase
VPASMNSPVPTYPVPGTLDDVLGFELVDLSDGQVHARFAVAKQVTQPYGLVHGGAYAALAESMVSIATHTAVEAEGSFAVGQSNSTTFLRPVTAGSVHAEGVALHRGRTTWIWDVRFTDDDDRLCAISRLTMAVRPQTG